MDIRNWNRDAWNHRVDAGIRWTVPVDSSVIQQAREGKWELFLTSSRPVPGNWFPVLDGLSVLCLAGAGGQQAPILAAAGACVTVLDNSPAQLGQDDLVAQREGLTIKTVEGDMADLSMFEDETFGLIVHPCSNCFVPDVRPVWREAFRVLRPGGVLLAGFVNPLVYLFNADALEIGDLTVTQTLPWSTVETLSQEELAQRKADGEPLWFGHLLTDQIGGQIDAGFMLGGFYEDDHGDDDRLSRFTPWLIGTRAVRPVREAG